MDSPPLPEPTDLGDQRIVLRPWQAPDATEMFDAVHESISHLARWLPWCSADYGLADARNRITECRSGWQSGELLAFAVRERASGQLLGSVGLSRIDPVHRSANLGYWIRRTQLGRGLAARAARLVAHFGFARLRLIRIEIVTEPDNHASRRTAERCGARLEAIARHRLHVRGTATDAAVYTLVPSDLDERA